MRALAPVLGIFLLAGMIGCGGDTAGTGSDGSTDGGSGSNSRPAAGSYTATLNGTDTSGVTYSGSGTATAASDGTITISYSSTASTGSPATTTRTLTGTISTTGTMAGSLVIGGTETRTASGTLVKNSNGTYDLTSVTSTATDPIISETDHFTLAIVTPASGNYTAVNTGTDNKGATYTGTGTLAVTSGPSFSLNYTSSRHSSGSTVDQTHGLVTTFATDGTFTGSLSLGLTSTSVTGTWSIGSNGVVTLVLKYTNGTVVPNPLVTETVVCTPA